MKPYDVRQLVGEARLFAKDKTIGQRAVSIIERLADMVEKLSPEDDQ